MAYDLQATTYYIPLFFQFLRVRLGFLSPWNRIEFRANHIVYREMVPWMPVFAYCPLSSPWSSLP